MLALVGTILAVLVISLRASDAFDERALDVQRVRPGRQADEQRFVARVERSLGADRFAALGAAGTRLQQCVAALAAVAPALEPPRLWRVEVSSEFVRAASLRPEAPSRIAGSDIATALGSQRGAVWSHDERDAAFDSLELTIVREEALAQPLPAGAALVLARKGVATRVRVRQTGVRAGAPLVEPFERNVDRASDRLVEESAVDFGGQPQAQRAATRLWEAEVVPGRNLSDSLADIGARDFALPLTLWIDLFPTLGVALGLRPSQLFDRTVDFDQEETHMWKLQAPIGLDGANSTLELLVFDSEVVVSLEHDSNPVKASRLAPAQQFDHIAKVIPFFL